MLRLMKLKVDKMSQKDKKIALVIDEMQIQSKKEYDPVTGTIMGFPTVPPATEMSYPFSWPFCSFLCYLTCPPTSVA